MVHVGLKNNGKSRSYYLIINGDHAEITEQLNKTQPACYMSGIQHACCVSD